ncbi:hypothetical protein D9M72_483050 [compost metagenome]
MVGIDHADHGHAQLVGFGHGNLVVADVDHEDRVRHAAHVLDAADRLFQLQHLALEHQRFLLAHGVQRAGFLGGFHVLQALDRDLDRLEVGQHAAEPAGVDVGHAGTASFFSQDFARLALGAHEKDGAAIGCQLTHVLHGVLEHRQRLFEVDDVDLVAMAEDEGGHLRVPEAGLVAEVATGFQHFAHGNGHVNLQRVRSEARPDIPEKEHPG